MSETEQTSQTVQTIPLAGVDQLALLGFNDSNIAVLEARFNTTPIIRGEEITLRGSADEVEVVGKVFREMIYMVQRNGSLVPSEVDAIVDLVVGGGSSDGKLHESS